MKITIINFRKITKYIFIFFIVILLLAFINNLKKIVKQSNEENIDIFLIGCLKHELPITNLSTNNNYNVKKENLSLKILSMQVGIFGNLIKAEDTESYEENNDEEIDKISEINENELIDEKLEEEKKETNDEKKETSVIDSNNIKATFTNKNETIEINNQTSFDITELMNNSEYKFNENNKVIIYHTHTCESYTATEKYNYSMTDSYRTNDLNYTVAKVGDELTSQLEKYNFTVIHNKTYHDYPSYNGSYGRSLSTLQNIFANNKDAEIVIDLHRDAVGSKSDYAPRVQIGDEVCAQVMFVVGTDGSGLNHPNWKKNLQYAIEVQKVANELYPGLFRPIILRNARYNQQLTTASTIIEVGATGNTLEECLASMKYLAEVINKTVEKN